MINSTDLMALGESSSLVRSLFNRNISLSELKIPILKIPNDFERIYFWENGFNLKDVSDYLREFLGKNNVFCDYKKVIPGVIEAVKNAREHGNKYDNNKKVTLRSSCENNNLTFLVQDQGGEIDGNLVPYVLLFRQNNPDSFLSLPDFYSFRGDYYAPEGHSGVGTKVMNICFPNRVNYFRGKEGLIVSLSKDLNAQ